MIFVVDNHDSFTFNLIQYLKMLKVKTLVKANDEIDMYFLSHLAIDGILISPGPGIPKNAGQSLEVIEKMAGKVPILGICLGHQAICETFGGEIIKAPKPMHGKISEITHSNTDLFLDLPNPLKVTRYHSLVVNENTLPKDLEITAKSLDDNLIMGIRHKSLPIYGVQFHPEALLTEHGVDIMKNFLLEAKKFKNNKR